VTEDINGAKQMKVIVAVDDSPYSKHLTDAIGHRHWPEDTQFRVLNVIEPINSELLKTLEPCERQEIVSRRKHHAETVCDKARHAIIESVPHASVHYEIREGDPRTQILESATDWQANRIMVGAKGRQVCPHYLLGSVSRAIATHAGCSVEIVREQTAAPKSAPEKSSRAAVK
jgi:nucleotide-binding universal stress UspA family protein